jgi:thiol-disulfide isomerase/thioredoxin
VSALTEKKVSPPNVAAIRLCSVKEDRLYPLSFLPAALLVGTFLQSAAAQDAPAVPDIMPPAGVLSDEETPPPPIAAPLESVAITPPHLIELQQKLRDHPGQIAQVSLSAYDVSRYGNLEGEVQRIAQNTTQEQNMPPFYETLIAIPKPQFSKSDDEVEIVPGMTVMVDLIGQKRTVLNYIMTPLNRAAGVAFREN